MSESIWGDFLSIKPYVFIVIIMSSDHIGAKLSSLAIREVREVEES